MFWLKRFFAYRAEVVTLEKERAILLERIETWKKRAEDAEDAYQKMKAIADTFEEAARDALKQGDEPVNDDEPEPPKLH